MIASPLRRFIRPGNNVKTAASAAVGRIFKQSIIPEPLEDRRLMSVVSVFANNAYVDMSSGGVSAEGVNIQKSLVSVGNTVKTFTGFSSHDLRQAAGKAETLLIPELENGDLSGAMDATAKSALATYVAEGGGLILCADYSAHEVSLLNSVFGFSTTAASGDTSTRTAAASGTSFSSAPLAIDANNAVNALSNLPSGAQAIYTTPGGASTVTLIPYGSGKIVVLGWDFYDAAPIGSQDGGWLTVLSKAVAQTKVTDTDPDDELGEAKPAVIGGTYVDSISVGSDVDTYKFTATAGDVLTFSMNKNSGSNVDSYLRLFNDNGDQVGGDDDSGGNHNALFTKTINFTGNYYISCSGWPNTSYDPYTGFGDNPSGTTGAYTLKITAKNLDPDDQISEAPLVSVPKTISAKIASATDVNMIKITVAKGKTVHFDIDRPAGSSLDSYLRLFNSSGTELSENDNGVAPGESATGKDPYLVYTFSTAGTYYIGISSKGNSAYSPTTGTGDTGGSSTGAYTLTLS
jgi:hypothetical protein